LGTMGMMMATIKNNKEHWEWHQGCQGKCWTLKKQFYKQHCPIGRMLGMLTRMLQMLGKMTTHTCVETK
jgi:hypothetical protein